MHLRTHTHQPNQPVWRNNVSVFAQPQQQERTHGFLMESHICFRLTHFKDRLYQHYKEHAPYHRELARTMDEEPELSYQEYTELKAQLLPQK